MKIKASFYGLVLLAGGLLLASCGQQAGAERVKQHQGASEEAPSIYEFAGKWDNQFGDTLSLSSLEGKIPVVAMIFTRCAYACPRMIADLRNIEEQVPPEKKDKVVFVLVSFDDERDNSETLKKFAADLQLSDKWLLLHGDQENVRELSMLLNVKYKKQPDGSYSHSNVISLLNESGAIASQVEGLGTSPEPMVAVIKSM